jgi:hypothetical protein
MCKANCTLYTPISKCHSFNNTFIKINQMTSYNYEWIRKGVTFIQDLLNDDGDIMTKLELENKYGIVIRVMQCNSLIHAILWAWTKLLAMDIGLNHTYTIYIHCKLMIDDCPKRINKINTKEIYQPILEPKSLWLISENVNGVKRLAWIWLMRTRAGLIWLTDRSQEILLYKAFSSKLHMES